MASSSPRILVLDGGMGTTLESMNQDVSGRMWGSELLAKDPSAIAAVHSGFISSGADIVQTATYQMTLPALVQSGYSLDEAKRIMRSSVSLARSTCTAAQQVALSIGPFGSTLSPGQEYAGIYPPPYGPPSTSTTSGKFELPDQEELERAAIDALADFHYDKVSVFAQDAETWAQIQWIAFETIPLLREITAIRKCMTRLRTEGREKNFWITSAFTTGITTFDMEAYFRALFHDEAKNEEQEMAVPHGIGINCTSPQYLTALSTTFNHLLREENLTAGSAKPKPWFVIYPDGGQVYDVVTRSWKANMDGLEVEDWAKNLAGIAKTIEMESHEGERVWAGVIVGGCCKAGFREISALRQDLDT
ncbi:hypothetical protein P7C73_g5198, partial [Tremellales sp. Uapishka_1]